MLMAQVTNTNLTPKAVYLDYSQSQCFFIQARVHAEVQAQTLQRQRVIEEKKMREMEKIREQLEKLLDEERQAKKDEEIVRTLQARILNEEWARRETLEKLQEEQKKMLEAERKKREEFEKMQNDKERELKGNAKIKSSLDGCRVFVVYIQV